MLHSEFSRSAVLWVAVCVCPVNPRSWLVPPPFPVWSPVSLLPVSVGSFLSRVSAHLHCSVSCTSERCPAASVSVLAPFTQPESPGPSVEPQVAASLSLLQQLVSLALCVCIISSFPLIHSPVDGHLDSFHVPVSTVNSAVTNVCFWIRAFSWICPGVALQDRTVALFLFFRNLHTVLYTHCPNLHSYNGVGRSPLLSSFSYL